MPELPDVTVYVERLARRVVGKRLQRIKVLNPFLLRTAVPPLAVVEGKRVEGVERLGKRIVLALEGELFLVIHLMIAGRLQVARAGQQAAGADRAGAVRVRDRRDLAAHRGRHAAPRVPASAPGPRRARGDGPGRHRRDDGRPRRLSRRGWRRENHTLKRALTDPQLFSGIGNAYSDEILHRARMSPLALTRTLDAGAVERLYAAARAVLAEWTERLGAEADRAGGWPEKVTAFHPQMAVHGRFGQPCPVCGAPVQRIVHADNETNYCARCQTGGKLLADRALSRLLKESWPKNIDELG